MYLEILFTWLNLGYLTERVLTGVISFFLYIRLSVFFPCVWPMSVNVCFSVRLSDFINLVLIVSHTVDAEVHDC